MENRIEKLMKKVGRLYKMFSDEGNYEGCFYPIYQVHPESKHYKLPYEDPKNPKNFKYGIKKILKECKRIKREEAKAGDIVACEYKKELHVGLMLDNNKFIHVFRDHRLQIDRFDFYEKRFKFIVFFRKKEQI